MQRSTPTTGTIVVTACLLLVAILLWPMQDGVASTEDARRPAEAPRLTAHVGGKRLYKGFFEGLQMPEAPPSFWVYVEDDTIDGIGVEYYLYHASYLEPGPANPSVVNELLHHPAALVTTLEEAKTWIAANHAHVGDPSELLVHRHDVSMP